MFLFVSLSADQTRITFIYLLTRFVVRQKVLIKTFLNEKKIMHKEHPSENVTDRVTFDKFNANEMTNHVDDANRKRTTVKVK